jgi:hypothetical protein
LDVGVTLQIGLHCVLRAIDTLKVFDVLTGSVTAQVVDLEALGDGTSVGTPDKPVEHLSPIGPTLPVIPILVHSLV